MFDEMGVSIRLPVGDLSAPAAPKNPVDDYMLNIPSPQPHSYDQHQTQNPRHSHKHHSHRVQHDEEAQWNPRVSLPLQRS